MFYLLLIHLYGTIRTFCRNICARDWCAEHPDGTVAEFKHYYDHEIPNDLKKVGLVIPTS
jgi:hypothetical protein